MPDATATRVALVTGGNRGIGFALVARLAEQGYRVVMAARDIHRGEAARQALGDSRSLVEPCKLDITRSEDARSLANWIADSCGYLDVLINNAGIMSESRRATSDNSADPMKVSPAVVLEHFNVNTVGAVRMIQALAPLIRQGGRIINVSSGMGQLAAMGGGYLAYRLSKAALNATTLIFANELRSRDIHVYAVCPGWVQTEMGGSGAPRSQREGTDSIVWLATSEPAPEGGRLYRDRKPMAW